MGIAKMVAIVYIGLLMLFTGWYGFVIHEKVPAMAFGVFGSALLTIAAIAAWGGGL